MKLYEPTILLFAFLHFFTLLKFSIGVDTLLPNQTIVVGQTLISPNQVFEMGFFSPGSSKNTFLGIWYKATPDVVVWVANRESPIADSTHLFFTIFTNGTPAITSCGTIVWSANASHALPHPILQLLDSGNLVLVDLPSAISFQSYAWQSFDHPTDTLLPGMKLGTERYLTSWKSSDDPSHGDMIFKIVNQGLPDMVLFKGTKKIYRTGAWNGVYFNGLRSFPAPVFNPKVVFDKERLISFSMAYDNSIFTRTIVEQSGSMRYLILKATTGNWHTLTSNAEENCSRYGMCGPFAICSSGTSSKCHCLIGYVPKFQHDWDLEDWSGGCTRSTPMGCQTEDHGFVEITGIKTPDMLQYSLNSNLSLNECRALCLRNCSCKAYANPYVTNEGSSCLMWFGNLIDIKYVPRTDKKQSIYVRVLKSELDSKTDLENGKKNQPIMLIVIGIVSGVVFTCLINGGRHFLTRSRREETRNDDLELPLYKLSTIMIATNNFSTQHLLGEGGFGPVYKANLVGEGEVAVKRLSRNSRQGVEEFKNEVMLIVKLQHRNLVRLLGCCTERDERILIYEYLPNRSLDTFIFDENRSALLTWPERFNIIVGIARGLLYLHHDSRLKIIHRDLKTSNILLDGNLNPKISDFGLARTLEEDQSSIRTTKVAGTYGYMSPEYAMAGKFSTKSDTYSFGVVLLEIVSGKKNRSFTNCYPYYSLLEYAWLLWKQNEMIKLMDECLNSTCIVSQVERCIQIGLLCVEKNVEDRADMISVCCMLSTSSDQVIQLQPKEPGFCSGRSSNNIVKTCHFEDPNFQKGTMTISDLEAR